MDVKDGKAKNDLKKTIMGYFVRIYQKMWVRQGQAYPNAYAFGYRCSMFLHSASTHGIFGSIERQAKKEREENKNQATVIYEKQLKITLQPLNFS